MTETPDAATIMATRYVLVLCDEQRARGRHDPRVESWQRWVFENSGMTFPRSDRSNFSQREIRFLWIERTPRVRIHAPVARRKGRYDLANRAGCAGGFVTSGYALSIVASWSPRLSASMGRTSMFNGWVFPVEGCGRFPPRPAEHGSGSHRRGQKRQPSSGWNIH